MTRKFTFFVHMNATKAWLRLTRQERNQFFNTTVADILSKYPNVSLRLYDLEAFSGRCSDIAVYETDDVQQYYFLIEALRDTEIYTKPYFEIIDIFPAIEDGFVEYEESLS